MAEHGTQLWKGVPNDSLPEALADAQQVISRIQDPWDAAANYSFLYSFLARFLKETRQREVLDLAFESAARDSDDPGMACGMVLDQVTEYISENMLSYYLTYFVEHLRKPILRSDRDTGWEAKALNKMARRIGNNHSMSLLEACWPAVQRLDWPGEFIENVSTGLDKEWLEKCIVLAAKKCPTSSKCQEALCERWLNLQEQSNTDAYEVWCAIIHEFSKRSRQEFLKSIDPYFRIAGKWGALDKIGESIVELGNWWS